MLREHAPLIVVSTILSIVLYLLFRDLRSLRAGLEALAAQCLCEAPKSLPPAPTEPQAQASKAAAEPSPPQPTSTAPQPPPKATGKRA